MPHAAPGLHRDGWIYEEKYDGWRMLAYKDGDRVKLISRTGHDHTKRFLELVGALRALPARTLILDGEVCIFDERLVSRVEWLRRRPQAESLTPALFMAFDCLYAHREDLRERTLRVRRHVLEAQMEHHLVLPARRLADEGLTAWQEVIRRGYEGLVAKDPASPYVGGRTLKWVKVKQSRYREGRPRPAG